MGNKVIQERMRAQAYAYYAARRRSLVTTSVGLKAKQLAKMLGLKGGMDALVEKYREACQHNPSIKTFPCTAWCDDQRDASSSAGRIARFEAAARNFVDVFQAVPPTRKPAPPKPTIINPNTDAFLVSYEWRRVRMEALKKYGSRCQCCGATPAHGIKINVDHIKPRRLFPQLALDVNNLQILCEECNHGKGNWDMTDWRELEDELTPEQADHMKAILG